MVADIQRDVARFTPHPKHASWFRRLENKLRGVYNVLTCSRYTDVVPRHGASRPRLTRQETARPPHTARPLFD